MNNVSRLFQRMQKGLLDAGYKITVEKSGQRSIDIEDYAAVGCDIAEEGSWVDAPKDAFYPWREGAS